MLVVENLSVNYGAIKALVNVSCRVDQGEIVALIGANGAGKTTILNTISSIVPAAAGRVLFEGEDITKTAPHEIVKRGVCQVPEGRRVFSKMSVLENLEMGAYIRSDKKGIAQEMERIFHLFPRLAERKKQLAKTLSGGEQQMLAMGRALMSQPRLLLLDEPSMGLAPMLVEKIFEIIGEINGTGTTIMLVEQNAHMALSIAHRAYVLETGQIVLEGPARELAENPEVRKAYLGE
ncbi:ABC transporter ATP-binding protein [Geobacter sulfurreducens]|uniref:Branched-chain amino acid ABC transporter, ATP-binding protein n=1 Tax=Geobacter sulfurreducens (strain ATCC 51573 / DSM 12127 / PCA) TaxID=243231 RepID=Q746X7_GEOSL|nr:ABC transporter ATP-binding protein [Geobacter sulfurreducens]AAR36781.1 branched-chain amino acid ABC transporter, ATP-binding protein [Geobacter sulfurreducens PCA]ADI86148.1 branched-chain amino acid ABC transporter, ATP-binding protein [Geobacter sulfurreducens KN400]QVW35201.1 ABC transporter ATP-binding protein [Geobacter sulfurreducens]UAC04038.1 ABC transporter ATP-binding protein [Geobacter sulfurreducens]UTG92675.1 ABC transporter ATP-binding protein [Geobacter sulfurreducens]